MRKKYILSIFVLVFVFIIAILINARYYNEDSTWESNLTRVYQSSLVAGDIDNDGDLDLVIGGCASGGLTTCTTLANTKVYINNGTILTENSTWQNNLEKIFRGSLVFGDIDNDGDLDLALCGDNGTDGIVRIYTNNGTTLIESNQWQNNFSGTNPWGCSLAFGDIDNDGDLDLGFVGADSSTKNGIYINNGTSFIKSSAWLASLPVVGQTLGNGALTFGDIDNNGYLDLIFLGSSGINFYTGVYINNGTSLVKNNIWENNIWGWGWPSIILGDYDNDGDLDLFSMGTTAGDRCHLYINNGTTFIKNETEWTGLCGIFDGSLMLGDYDNDGDLDLAANGKEGATTIHNNNQTDFILDMGEWGNLEHLETGSSVLWLDLDNDTDLDLIEVGENSSGVSDAKIYISNVSLTKNNTLPTPPDTFTSDYSNNVLTLVWNNGSDAETNSTGLYYNLMVGNSTTNHTVVSGVYGGSSNPTAGYFGNMMQRKNITLNLELEANETYNWHVQTIDTGLAKSEWSAVQSFNTSIDTTKPTITINSPSPSSGSYTTNPFFTFNITVTDANVSNVTLYADWTGSMIVNETNSSGINGTYIFEKNLTGYSDAMYSWYIKAYDGDSNFQTSTTRTFYLDRAYPIVNSISPANAYSSSSSSITFSYNVTDTDIANCSLIIDGSVDQTDTSITEDTTQTFTKSLSNADYTWNINCTDYVNYENSSSNRSLTVSYTAPTNGGSPGGGGGGSSTTTTTIITTPKEFDIDFSTSSSGTFETQQGDIKTFSFNSQIKHSITVMTLTTDSITLLITSDPITVQINVGETKQIDINQDNINDFEIKLISIIYSKAKFLLTKLEGADIVAIEELEEAIRKEALFDVKISIVNLFEVVKAGREVIAEIEAFNVNNIGQVDIAVDYYLTTKKDNQTKLAQGSDTLAVEAVTSFVRSLTVPLNFKSGKYLFNVDVTYQDKLMASGSAEFRVIRNYEIIIIIGIIILIIVSIFVYLWTIKRKGEKDVGGLKRKEKRDIGFLKKEIKKLKTKRKKNVNK